MNYTIKNLSDFNLGYFKQKTCILVYTVFMLIPFVTFAQDELPRHYKDYDVNIKSEGVQNRKQSEVISHTISEEGAIWLRLFFKDVNLGNNSTLTITSVLDGAKQTLTAATIHDWKNTTAYFNGDKVIIELMIAPGEHEIGVNINKVGVGEIDPAVRTICGPTDDRVDSNDDAIGRLVPVGCTGWIISNGKLVTAGHCVAGGSADIIEFNVPKSNPDRTIVHPGPEDQYPVSSFISPYPNDPSPATDWAVFRASENSETGKTPLEAQNKAFNVMQTDPGDNITITGYGVDDGIDNQTQQTHTGPLVEIDNTHVRYNTDTTGGNSGSPIIDAATGNAIGVHAYGGCPWTGSNFGERVTIPAFWEAMGQGGPTTICSGNVFSFPYDESFEEGLGNHWVNNQDDDDLDWITNSGATPSLGTGPNSAFDGDSYIYVEASGNGTGSSFKTAILNSPCLNFWVLDAPKLSFRYHMFGRTVGTLAVEARTDDAGDWTTVFTKTGMQGFDWKTAEVDLSAYAGNSSVQLRFNVVTGSNWLGDIAIDAVNITNANGFPPECDDVDFNDFTIESFANQDVVGDFSIQSGGASLSLQNNTWKYIAMNYIVTENTVVEFDFSSTSEGEIHGIAFEDNNGLSQSRVFKVHGIQDYGITNFDDYIGGTKRYAIPVGNFYTGNMDRLVFINDFDAGSGNTSVFSNIKVHEGSCDQSSITAKSLVAQLESVTAIMGKEGEGDLASLSIRPNPVKDVFSIHLSQYAKGNVTATVYSILGSKKAWINLVPGVNMISTQNLSLSRGVYLIKIDSSTGESVTKKLIIN
ncbi:trypsin-like peptidase domain-containing protein [Aquimarina sediminis]|uniref:trypsin-like peptidase domain-containing protein n=1 Tax=Aquimarina sediminis TaxID=2070536 RepID=UPI0013E8D756|nr:trypsin-like peptidase domain-containing protein [Aquimarina sediminis]